MSLRDGSTRTDSSINKSDICRAATTTHEYERIGDDTPHCQLRSDATLVVIDEGNDTSDVDKTQQEEDGKYHRKREPSGRKEKFKFLNGVRGLACLLVVHHHAGYFLETTIAPSSVDTFFVLSAFLLTTIYEPKIHELVTSKERVRNWTVVLLDYSVKRFLRVYPLFALVAFVLTCMPEATRTHYYKLGHYNIKSWSLWDILMFKKRYYLFWTMAIQVTYFCILPVFLTGVSLLGKLKWFVVGLLYSWVYYEGWHANRTGHGEFRPHLSTFVAGSLSALVYSKMARWMKKHRFEPLPWHLAVVRSFELTMIGVMLSDISRGKLATSFLGYLFPCQDKMVPSVSLPLSAVIVIEALIPSALSRAFEWNALCFTGKISFSVYLLHPFVNFLPWLSALPRIDQFVIRLVLVYSLSTASYFLVERNCERLAIITSKRLSRSAGLAKGSSVYT